MPKNTDKYSNHQYIKLSLIQGFVTNINPDNHSITYNTIKHDTSPMTFNKCLIATGGSPKLFYLNDNKHKKKP